jgi:uncharacterized delta-60 repeat protein
MEGVRMDSRRSLTRFGALSSIAVVLVATAGVPAHAAQPGSLDPTFGNQGKVVLSLGAPAGFEDVVALSGGKLLAAGFLDNAILLMRFTADGKVDHSFGGGDGRTTTTFANRIAGSGAVALTTGGKILVGGAAALESNLEDQDLALVRYLPDGSLDHSFGGGDGKVLTDVLGGTDIFDGMDVQGGKAVMLSESRDGTPLVPVVLRYTAAGNLDHTFSGDGKFRLPTIDHPFLEAVTQLSGGKIVAAGQAAPGGNSDFALYRIKVGGGLDPTFGTGGAAFTDFAGDADIVDALAVDSQGRILAAGAGTFAGEQEFAVARYTPAGDPDTNFNGTGTVATNVGPGFDRIFAMALQADGKIVVGGESDTASGDERWAIARYGSGGSLNAGFGNGGIATTNFSTSLNKNEEVDGLAIQASGRIVGVGFTGNRGALAGYVG